MDTTVTRPTRSDRREAFRAGYRDGQYGAVQAIPWGSGGVIGHEYGMGYFHGRAHRPTRDGGTVTTANGAEWEFGGFTPGGMVRLRALDGVCTMTETPDRVFVSC